MLPRFCPPLWTPANHPPSAASMSEQHAKVALEFKKKPKSSPSQIRVQFMAKVAGNETITGPSNDAKTLRPVKAVLSRLRFDPKFNVDEFVIGYIERTAGIIEIPVTDWNDQESQDCIAYFKNVAAGKVIWDRVSKTDLLSS